MYNVSALLNILYTFLTVPPLELDTRQQEGRADSPVQR
jgi:hypothetical protein